MAETDYPQWVEHTGLNRSIRFLDLQVGTGLLGERFTQALEAFVFEEYRSAIHRFIGMTEVRLRRRNEEQRFKDGIVAACRQEMARIKIALRRAKTARKRLALTIEHEAWEQMSRFADQVFPADRDAMLKPKPRNRESQRLRAAKAAS